MKTRGQIKTENNENERVYKKLNHLQYELPQKIIRS